MAVWLQAGALLFLLAVSIVNTNGETQHRLCGSDLVGAFMRVCGSSKRDVDLLLGFIPPQSGQENEVSDFAFKDHAELIRKRGIVEQCCFNTCTYTELKNYC
ncbi:insulin-like isoform X1 [Myxocyprinus asiaticus]|uniref:insulin-like isoform X1 n=1 Tax=Myxocyprinus asiaticus TaxID=70543 RepID=UPI0022215B88|nr:insulin-like isoform X1 [Myxocyprinus asiaticus]XP_051531988.1 insulin-like isoform X1 [Myxocyprinus asiaticus]